MILGFIDSIGKNLGETLLVLPRGCFRLLTPGCSFD